jgi:hypothetical protein
MSSINDPFKNVDFSDLPEARYVTARDGTKLAFRPYSAAGDAVKGSVVLLHGSSASSSSMHVMAKGFSAAQLPDTACTKPAQPTQQFRSQQQSLRWWQPAGPLYRAK